MSAAYALGELEPTELLIDRFIADMGAGKLYEPIGADPTILPRYRAWREKQQAPRNGWMRVPRDLIARLTEPGMTPYLAKVTGISVDTLRWWKHRNSAHARAESVRAVLAAVEALDGVRSGPPPRYDQQAEKRRADAVFEEGCQKLGIDPDFIRHGGRFGSHARHVLMRYLRNRGFSTPVIAKATGLKNHTSVLHGLRKVGTCPAGAPKATDAGLPG